MIPRQALRQRHTHRSPAESRSEHKSPSEASASLPMANRLRKVTPVEFTTCHTTRRRGRGIRTVLEQVWSVITNPYVLAVIAAAILVGFVAASAVFFIW